MTKHAAEYAAMGTNMNVVPNMNGVGYRNIPAGRIPQHGVFFWMNKFYSVISNGPDKDYFIQAKPLMSAWTANPYNRFQADDARPDRFNGYCEVWEVIYVQ